MAGPSLEDRHTWALLHKVLSFLLSHADSAPLFTASLRWVLAFLRVLPASSASFFITIIGPLTLSFYFFLFMEKRYLPGALLPRPFIVTTPTFTADLFVSGDLSLPHSLPVYVCACVCCVYVYVFRVWMPVRGAYVSVNSV